MQDIKVTPIGCVRNEIKGPKEDFWGGVESRIVLDVERFTAAALEGLGEFSHVEILFYFDRVENSAVVVGSRHPRGNPDWPLTGIFAQRGKARPNRIGATICHLVSVSGSEIAVSGLDALDGTPVLDIKPVLAEFLPDKSDVRQPQWSHELMAEYSKSHR